MPEPHIQRTPTTGLVCTSRLGHSGPGQASQPVTHVYHTRCRRDFKYLCAEHAASIYAGIRSGLFVCDGCSTPCEEDWVIEKI